MIELKDGILLYHGSYTEISKIDLSKCLSGLDFGKGFYLTSSFEQAYAYVPLSVQMKQLLKKLLPDRLQDQFCFRTEDAVKSLEFVRSDRYGDIKR